MCRILFLSMVLSILLLTECGTPQPTRSPEVIKETIPLGAPPSSRFPKPWQNASRMRVMPVTSPLIPSAQVLDSNASASEVSRVSTPSWSS